MTSRELARRRRRRWLFTAACLCAAGGGGLDLGPAAAQPAAEAPRGEAVQQGPAENPTPAAPDHALGPGLVITPSVALQEMFTDNATLTEHDRQSDFITRALLGLRISVAHGPATANLGGDAAYDHYARTDGFGGWTFTGDGAASYSLVPKLLSLDADGTLSTQYVNIFNTTALDRSGSPGRTRLAVYRVGPSLTARVADFADLNAQARYGQVLYAEADSSQIRQLPSDASFVQAALSLDTGKRIAAYQLLTTVQLNGDQHGYRSAIGLQSIYVNLTPTLRLIARAGYEHTKQTGLFDIDAPLATAGFEYRPNSESRISVEAGTRYHQTTYAAAADVKVASRVFISAHYAEALTPDQIYVANNLETLLRQGANMPPPIQRQNFTLQENLYSQASLNKRADVSLMFRGPVQSLDLSAAWSDRKFVLTQDHDRTLSGTLTFNRHLRPDLDFTASGNYAHSSGGPLIGASKTWGADAELVYHANRSTDLRGGYNYRRSEELFQGGLAITENAVWLRLEKRF